jgi:hypothetical protein
VKPVLVYLGRNIGRERLRKKALRKIFVPKRVKERGYRRGLRNGKLDNLYPSPKLTSVIKSRTMGLAGRVAHMRKRKEQKRFCL